MHAFGAQDVHDFLPVRGTDLQDGTQFLGEQGCQYAVPHPPGKLLLAVAPEAIDVILINHPEIEPSGGGEPSMRPIAAAVANAIYDATGVRLRQAPFTAERLKAGFV